MVRRWEYVWPMQENQRASFVDRASPAGNAATGLGLVTELMVFPLLRDAGPA